MCASRKRWTFTPVALDNNWNCVFIDSIKLGVRGKPCCPTCEGWDLVIYWSSLTCYLKAWSCDTHGSGSWQTHCLLPRRTSSLVFLLPLSKIPNTSAVSTLWHHAMWVSQEWIFLRHWSERHETMLKILPGVFSGRFFRSQQNFVPEVSPLAKPAPSPFAGNSTIYARAVSEPSPGQSGTAGTSLPAVPSSGNKSLRFKCFFVYEIKSTRPIANCLC